VAAVVIGRDGANSKVQMVPRVPLQLTMMLRDLPVVAEAGSVLIEARRACCYLEEKSSRRGMAVVVADYCDNLTIA
jgi:hypothetical protein